MRQPAVRKTTNTSLDVMLVRADKWRVDNREAVACWNAYVDEHGLPLARHRRF